MNKSYRLAKEKINEIAARQPLSSDEVNILLNELQVYQLELEMQNDELKASYVTLDLERAKFADLFDLAPVSYFILDYIGVIEEVNQNGADMLGLSKKSILMRRFQAFVCPESVQDFYNFLHRLQSSNVKQNADIKFPLSGDEIMIARLEGIVVPHPHPNELKYYIALIDVTLNRNAQQALKETKERLERTLIASSAGTWTVDFENNQASLDKYSLDILDIDSKNFKHTVDDLIERIHPDDRPGVMQRFAASDNSHAEMNIEYRLLAQDGSIRYISAKGQQIRDAQGQTFLAGLLMDITEQKRMQQEAEELKNNQQKLILAATLTAQEKERDAVSRALHDSVCQLLYGIKLNLESMIGPIEPTLQFKNVNELLDQAIKETRQLSYELTPIVLKDFGFVAGVKEMAQRTSTNKFKIDTFIDNYADSLDPEVQLYLFRMIQELITNSIKHASATRAEIMLMRLQQQIIIRVTDNGRGMATTPEDAVRSGSGLRGIENRLYLLNGKIVYNTNKGLEVTITLQVP